MSRPEISVVIPSRDRADLLSSSLSSLERQSLPKDRFEVVVVSDGSRDHTDEVVARHSGRLDMRYFAIASSGIAAAKNVGLFAAVAPIVLFFDDDDIADENLLRAHLLAHKKDDGVGQVVLGWTGWSADLSLTPFMHYITEVAGHLFSYRTLRHGQLLSYDYFWGGRSSCKKAFLAEHGIFDQRFSVLEDVELGFRLRSFGMKVRFDGRARSYMTRPIDLRSYLVRRERQGRTAALYVSKHDVPEVRAYCRVDEISAIIPEMRSLENDLIPEAEELERGVPNGDARLERDHPLHHAYEACLDAAYARGFLSQGLQ